MSAGGSCVFRRRSGKRRAGAGRLCREDREKLDRETVAEMVSGITVYGDRRIRICYKFSGECDGCLMSAVSAQPASGPGGRDPGKVAVNQTEEKDLNLEIALKLKNQLEKKGITVVMTRETGRGTVRGKRAE